MTLARQSIRRAISTGLTWVGRSQPAIGRQVGRSQPGCQRPQVAYEGGIFGKIQTTFNIHFSHIENPYGVYRAGNRDRTIVPGPLTLYFKGLKWALLRGNNSNPLIGKSILENLEGPAARKFNPNMGQFGLPLTRYLLDLLSIFYIYIIIKIF